MNDLVFTQASDEELSITPIAAAERQVNTAIELWFNMGDPVAIHTLTHAACDMIHSLTADRRNFGLFYDFKDLPDELRKEVVAAARKPGNFFKHAQHGETITFQSGLSEMMLIFCMWGLLILNVERSRQCKAYTAWLRIHDPELIGQKGLAQLAETYSPRIVNQVKSLSRSEFYTEFLLGVR